MNIFIAVIASMLAAYLFDYLFLHQWLINQSRWIRFAAGFALGFLITFYPGNGRSLAMASSVEWHWRVITGLIVGTFLSIGLKEYMAELRGKPADKIVKIVVVIASFVVAGIIIWGYYLNKSING